jgi:hypothetical protein
MGEESITNLLWDIWPSVEKRVGTGRIYGKLMKSGQDVKVRAHGREDIIHLDEDAIDDYLEAQTPKDRAAAAGHIEDYLVGRIQRLLNA